MPGAAARNNQHERSRGASGARQDGAVLIRVGARQDDVQVAHDGPTDHPQHEPFETRQGPAMNSGYAIQCSLISRIQLKRNALSRWRRRELI